MDDYLSEGVNKWLMVGVKVGVRRSSATYLMWQTWYSDTSTQTKKTDCNHIFLNFVPTLTLSDLAKVRSSYKLKSDATLNS